MDPQKKILSLSNPIVPTGHIIPNVPITPTNLVSLTSLIDLIVEVKYLVVKNTLVDLMSLTLRY